MTHPNLASAVQAPKMAGRPLASVVRDVAVERHAARIGLVPRWEDEGAMRLESSAGSDPRIVAAARTAARSQGSSRSRRTDFDPEGGAGEHAMRVAARVKALSLKPTGY